MMTVVTKTSSSDLTKESVTPRLVWDHLSQTQQLEVFQSLVMLCWQIAQSVETVTSAADKSDAHEVIDEGA